MRICALVSALLVSWLKSAFCRRLHLGNRWVHLRAFHSSVPTFILALPSFLGQADLSHRPGTVDRHH